MLELYGGRSCPYTALLREDLQWRSVDFMEYDVDQDRDALERLLQLRDGDRTIPVLVRDGVVAQVGWEGRGCYAGS